jgi:RND family efflux transporter MFP subunit
LPLTIATLLGAASVVLPALAEGAAPVSPRGSAVRVATVHPAPYAATMSLTGEVRPRASSQLSFRIAGRISERRVDVGYHVRKGDLLARLDPSQQIADVANAEAALTAAEAASRQATADFERQKALLDKGYTTQSAFDDAMKSMRTSDGNVEAANAALSIARANLGYTELRADADGIVTARLADAGEIASAARPIFVVAADGLRDAVFDVPEKLFLSLEAIPSVTISLVKDPSISAKGTVREISPTVDTTTGTVRVKVDIGTPPAEMSLGAPVSGRASGHTITAVRLPPQALAEKDGGMAVWVVGADSTSVELKPVEVAAFTTDSVVVDKGLADGDRVVIDGGKLLWPGVTIDIVEEVAR